MTAILRLRSFARLPVLVAAAGLTIALCLAEDVAAQSCGHYVKVGGYRGDAAHGAMDLVTTPAEAPQPADESAPLTPQPCSGPNCSGLPTSVPPPAAPRVSPPRMDLLVAVMTDNELDLVTAPHCGPALWIDERDNPERVFRPPK